MISRDNESFGKPLLAWLYNMLGSVGQNALATKINSAKLRETPGECGKSGGQGGGGLCPESLQTIPASSLPSSVKVEEENPKVSQEIKGLVSKPLKGS